MEEKIPGNGNDLMYDSANPGQQYHLDLGDGITIEVNATSTWGCLR